jgi:hypothetical protein
MLTKFCADANSTASAQAGYVADVWRQMVRPRVAYGVALIGRESDTERWAAHSKLARLEQRSNARSRVSALRRIAVTFC